VDVAPLVGHFIRRVPTDLMVTVELGLTVFTEFFEALFDGTPVFACSRWMNSNQSTLTFPGQVLFTLPSRKVGY
jgi:hypothetical protein